MKEYEYKFVLRKDELEQIESCLCNGTPRHISQTNYYYDTENYILDSAKMTCRIREINNNLKGTFKMHGKTAENGNVEIDFKVAAGTEWFKIGDIELRLMGALHTERKEYALQDGLKLVLDENSYLGTSDCELELEFTDKTKEAADKLMKDIEFCLYQYCIMSSYDASYYSNCEHKSKSERFMAIHKKMKNSANTVGIAVKGGDLK